MTFAGQLRPLIDKLDGGVSEAARLCEASRDSMHAWLSGRREPPLLTREGALAVLGRAAGTRKRAGGNKIKLTL